MRKLFYICLLITLNTNACDSEFCVGDKVFPMDWKYYRGGTVKAINEFTNMVTVQSNYNLDNYQFYTFQLSQAKGCLEYSCVDHIIYSSVLKNNRGGKILGINPYAKSFSVQSYYNSDVYFIPMTQISIRRGCIEGICVGDKVMPFDWTHQNGGIVVAINPYNFKITIKSNYNLKLYRYYASDLAVNTKNKKYSNDQRLQRSYITKIKKELVSKTKN
jgi:hypothetical protein